MSRTSQDRPELDLRGRAAVITGAASGIGRALARDAGRRGMSLAIADVDDAGLETLAEELRAEQVRVVSQAVDVRSAAEVERFAEAAFETFDDVALVFSNAGVIRYDPVVGMDLESWNLVLDVNLKGAVHCIAAFVRQLVERGAPAQFVLTGSQASFISVPELGAYVASKHAVWGLAEVLRDELAGGPVGVSLLAPSRVATAMIGHTIDTVRRAQGDEAAEALWRTSATPETVAALTLDQAAARAFYILPSDSFRPAFAERVAPLIGQDAGRP